MKNTHKIILGVVVIIAVALIVWAVATPPQGEKALQKSLKGTTFAQFVEEGGSYRCEISQATEAVEENTTEGEETSATEASQVDGTVYVKDGMIRGQYDVATEGSLVNLAFIVREGASYTWIPETTIGFMVNFTDAEDPEIQKSAMATYTFNLEEIGSYECYEEEIESSYFELPDGVRFQDLSF